MKLTSAVSFVGWFTSIKGLSGNIGANALRKITTAAEDLSENDYKIKSREYYTKIVSELFKARDELVKHSRSNNQSGKSIWFLGEING